MSFSEPRLWLIAYDIAEPRRIVRVHRFLKRHAVRVQYSVFTGTLAQKGLRELLGGLVVLIEPAEDDVRLYPLPSRCEALTLGRQPLPDGIWLTGSELIRFLPAALKPAAEEPTVE